MKPKRKHQKEKRLKIFQWEGNDKGLFDFYMDNVLVRQIRQRNIISIKIKEIN